MRRVLVLFAHPKFEKSRANKALVQAIAGLEGITFHDLYERYPHFQIDVAYEQKLLQQHDIIVWHHPIYWYSCPPLLKQWIDLVLEIGWAYGKGGEQLKGKYLFNAVSSGGSREVYQPEGRNRFSLRQFLAPFEQTAWLCHLQYLPPFAVQGTHRLTELELEEVALQYAQTLRQLQHASDASLSELNALEYLNDWKA
ncbi:MAG: NAD(P)H oxidoreductase [Sphingobacteriaceae bacterium]|nr:NAD(P)H oxidoreductase [Sphingobacteriaceae bacterium]